MRLFFKKIIVFILSIEAKIVLWKYQPKIVAVTGSVGKTSTKDAIYTVLSQSLYVRKSKKSHNSEIGIPLTILGIENAWSNIGHWIKNILEGIFLIILPHHYPRWLIIEAGVDRPGDMARIVKIIKADVAVITKFSKVPVHVEFFDSPEEVTEEKSKLVRDSKKDASLILNFDDKEVLSLKDKTHKKYITYGFEVGAGVRASNIHIIKDNLGRPKGMNFKVEYNGNSIPVNLAGLLGRQHIYPILSAIATASSLGLNVVESSQGLKEHETEPGRMRILEGVNNTVIIDDSYNSSPTALREALRTIENIEWDGRSILVIGDMMELGKYSGHAHKEVGELVPSVGDFLITVGPRAKIIAETAEAKMGEDNIRTFKNSIDAGNYLKTFIEEGDLILVKGSQSIRLEKALLPILKDTSKAGKLLVRQDEEWQNR